VPVTGALAATAANVVQRQLLLSRCLKWGTRGGLAIVDYGLISGSNFVVAVLLARWMPPPQYGAYAMGFSLYLLLLLLFQSIVLEPMSVFGSSTFRDRLRGYVRTVQLLCIIGSIIAGGLLGIASFAVHLLGAGSGLPGALAGVAVATPSLFYFWLTRRVFYLDLAPGAAAWGALLYVAVLIGGLSLARWYGQVSPFVALALMGVASSATDLALAKELNRFLPANSGHPDMREVLWRHWEYGRWATCSAIGSWGATNVYLPLLSSFAGMAYAGQMKALLNLTSPLSQTMASISMLALPYAARSGRQQAHPLSLKVTLVFTGLGVAYWAAVLPFQSQVFHFLYKGAYTAVIPLVPLYAVMSMLNSGMNGPMVMLRGLNYPDSVFVARTGGAVISMLVGIPATYLYGLYGATAGVILASLITFFLAQVLFKRRLNAC